MRYEVQFLIFKQEILLVAFKIIFLTINLSQFELMSSEHYHVGNYVITAYFCVMIPMLLTRLQQVINLMMLVVISTLEMYFHQSSNKIVTIITDLWSLVQDLDHNTQHKFLLRVNH